MKYLGINGIVSTTVYEDQPVQFGFLPLLLGVGGGLMVLNILKYIAIGGVIVGGVLLASKLTKST